MKKLLTSSLAIALLGSLSFWGVFFLVLHQEVTNEAFVSSLRSAAQGPDSPEAQSKKAKDFASWNYTNPDINELTRQIKDKKDELDRREEELEKLRERIAKEQADLQDTTNLIHALRVDIDRIFNRVSNAEKANMAKIVTIYQKMERPLAAKMLYNLEDEAEIAMILQELKEAEVSGIIKEWLKDDKEGGDKKLKRAHKVLKLYQKVIPDPDKNP